MIETLEAFADERAASTSCDVGHRRAGAQPAVSSVIAGATRPEQVAANVAAGSWIPSAEELAQLRAITA